MTLPDGFISAERASRILESGQRGLDDIYARLQQRIAAGLVGLNDPAAIGAVIAREQAVALGELAQLDALTLERIHAGGEH